MEWTEEKCLELINEYQDQELLWKPKHPQHFNKIRKQDAWEKIAQNMNIDAEECKKKMSSLLSSFRREISKMKKSRGTGTGKDEVYGSSWFAFKALIFIQDKDEPRQRLNTIAENNLSSDETGSPSVEESIQNLDSVDQTQSETSSQNSASQESLVQMPPPRPKPSTSKSTKRSKTNDERLDKPFRILEASASASIPNEESECQIFGKLVAKKLQSYSPDVRSIAQEELMKVLFKADRGFYMSNQQLPPGPSVSRQNLYNYSYPPTFNYNSSPDSHHPHHYPSISNSTLHQTSSPCTNTPAPQHSPTSNYFSNFSPNTPAVSPMQSDDGSNEIYDI